MARHPLRSTWSNMVRRCHDPNRSSFHKYGGRGIHVCPKWRGGSTLGSVNTAAFVAFVADIMESIGPKPSPIHTLDRINNDGGYEPGNVKWSTPSEQGRNTRFNQLVEFMGKILPLAEWCERLNLRPGTVRNRLRSGWPVEKALGTPTYMTYEEWAKNRVALRKARNGQNSV